MKTLKALTIVALSLLAPAITQANSFMNDAPKDTVVIELENGSRIIIYTRNKDELRRLQAYDVNRMIKDLNSSVQGRDVEFMEIENKDGKRYIIDSPKVLFSERDAEGDTIVVNEETIDRIRIRVGGIEMEVEPDEIDRIDDNSEFKKYSYVKHTKPGTRHYFNVDVGSNNWLENGDLPSSTDANYSVKPWGSWYLGINALNRTWVGGPLFIEWGGGVNWYNWKLEDASYVFEKGDTQVELTPVSTDIQGIKSKLSATYVNLSFVPMFDFGKGAKRVNGYSTDGFSFKTYRRTGFRIGAGLYGGYRMGSRAKLVFKEGGDSDSVKESDHFYLQNFRYGIRGQLGFRSFDMFVLYDLNDVFVDGRGPNGANLNAFTVGVTF